MITPEKARELLADPFMVPAFRVQEALETVITLGERVNAQAEQIERARALAALWDRTDEPAGESLLAALDGAS